MNTEVELMAYLEQMKENINAEFPKHEATTAELFDKVYAFFDIDFEELTDNRVYRCFLSFFKELICFAFDKGVSKAYLRCLFKSLNNEIIVRYLGSYAKSRTKDIKFAMDRFLNFFITTWQDCNNDKNRVLEHIVDFIDSQI